MTVIIGIDPHKRSHTAVALDEHDAVLDELMDAAIPESIRWRGELDLPPAASEEEATAELRRLAGMGFVLALDDYLHLLEPTSPRL